jgi:hypothetical protein
MTKRAETAKVMELFASVQADPEFVAGTIFIREDIAAALFRMPVEEVTERQLAAITDDVLVSARAAIRWLIFDSPDNWQKVIREFAQLDELEAAQS